MFNAHACRGARGILNWSVLKLHKESGVGLSAIYNFERGGGSHTDTVQKLEATFQRAGVEFEEGRAIRQKLLNDEAAFGPGGKS